MELLGIGLTITDFRISEFTYPENIQKRADQAAEYSMIGDMNRFQQVNMVDSMARGGHAGTAGSNATEFCPNCGQPTNGAKFCGNCGTKLV